MKIGIVTPIFPPQIGGAATYYDTLSREMCNNPIIDSVDIFTQKSSKRAHNSINKFLKVNGIFPDRQIPGLSIYRNIGLYFIQNIAYLHLVYLIYKKRLDVVIIHSSLFNQPNILNVLLRIFATFVTNCKFIVDFRDRLMPKVPLGRFSWAEKKVACSLNVAKYLQSRFGLKTNLIPIPVEFSEIHKINHSDREFILYAGSIDTRKNVELIISAFQSSSMLKARYDLILVGHLRNKEILKYIKCDQVKFIGSVSNREVRELMKSAKLTINISPIEGMPRVSLEAMWYSSRVILPPNIPEFELFYPDAVFNGSCKDDLIEFIDYRLSKNGKVTYPFENHIPKIVLMKLLELIK
jgi:glycosyltransferase involved in cell wall biosynthesis